jgi:glycosyltransferase involved in cell wall biosynthesis
MITRNDHNAMAEAALRLLSDPALAKRITRNARESSKKFMSPGVRAEWVRLYRELLPEKFARGESHKEANTQILSN